MRLGLCSNRTCWALPTFHTPLVQNFSFCTELCPLETLKFIDSEIKCFLQFHQSWVAYKNKFLLWLTWATNLASYWSTLIFWERCAYYHDIKPGELFIFADGELFWVVKKNEEEKKNARNVLFIRLDDLFCISLFLFIFLHMAFANPYYKQKPQINIIIYIVLCVSGWTKSLVKIDCIVHKSQVSN